MTHITDQIIYRPNFISNHQAIYDELVATVKWNEKMKARKTAGFGKPHEHSEHKDEFLPMTPVMEEMSLLLEPVIGFKANNCLLNYYETGKSKMGFHGDNTEILMPETGIAILSVGDNRIMQVRRNNNQTEIYNYILSGGSLFCMPIAMQTDWKHGIPKVVSGLGRISLTFREMK